MNLEIIRKIGNSVTPDFLRPFAIRVYAFLEQLSHPKISPLPELIGSFRVSEVFTFFKACQLYLDSNRMNGVYLEFGCNKANSFRIALNTIGKYTNPFNISHFYAFDSFCGMPEPEGIDESKYFRKGVLSTSVEQFKSICRRDLHRTTIVEGFYEDTLKDFELKDGQNIAVAFIDCDYYSSTKTVLEFLEKYLRHGMIIGFDDWILYYCDNKRGQRKAFHELRETMKNDFDFEEFVSTASGVRSFVVHDKKLVGTKFS